MALDLNAETYPYERVQYLLDQTATFTFYATPLPGYAETATIVRAPDDFFGINGGYGLSLGCRLHAFGSAFSVRRADVTVRPSIGCPAGEFHAVLRFVPAADATNRWSLTSEPAPAIYDRWRSQPCVLTEAVLTLGADEGLRAYGIGRTYPVNTGGEPALLLGAAGTLVEGTGTFRGHEASFSLCGTLTPALGFEGVIVCRIVDPQGDLATDADSEESGTAASVVPKDTFLVLRGQKKDRTVKTTFGPKPEAGLDSLLTPSEMRAVEYAAPCEDRAPRSHTRVGELIARMNADVRFNIAAPPGTAIAPTPFTTAEIYEFVDGRGDVVGTINAGVADGVAFGLQFPSAPGQPGVRFAGCGPITSGTGPFAGVRGLLTVNSVIGIAPHALSLTHVLHLVDSAGRWRGRKANA